MSVNDTIAAIATAPGRGGVGIVRLSGPQALTIAHQCVHLIDENTKKRTCAFSPRHAYFSRLIDEHNHVIDEGITLYFPNPHSFTGEDVVEFQGHGGPVVLDMVLHRMTSLGARIANPGEFSERAFLNDKIDLTQAEAIADLINANSKHAAVQATRSLRGAFAKEIDTLLEKLTQLRIFVESAIDFPEEEIDFLNDGVVDKKLSDLIEQVLTVTHKAQQGSVIREGMKVVLAGLPNSGKSTLLNTLTERDAAIVTDIEGTTRDTLTEHIHINGMPLHITDTAGLRETDDEVEKIGVARAWEAIAEADRVLLLLDGTALHKSDIQRDWAVFCETDALRAKLTIVINKTDALQAPLDPALTSAFGNPPSFLISALKNTGIDPLKNHLLEVMGLGTTQEGHFSARRRHLDALARGHAHLSKGQEQLRHYAAGELLAEDLRQAHNALGEITGKLSADDLLGEIFSSFCIGK